MNFRKLDWFFVLVTSLATSEFVKKERSKSRETFVLKNRASPKKVHEVTFQIKPRNLDELESLVHQRSSPVHEKYQQWLSFEELSTLTTNPEGSAIVLSWLETNEIEVSWRSINSDFINARAAIHRWEALFNTTFYEWEDRHPDNQNSATVIRAHEYSLDATLVDHVEAVFHTVQTPPVIPRAYHLKESNDVHRTVIRPNLRRVKEALDLASSSDAEFQTESLYTSVSFLKSFYGVGSYVGSALTNQSVFETSNEYFSPSDLSAFQSTYGLASQEAISIGNHSTASCTADGVDCYEANLDLQYIMGVSQFTSTVHWYVPGFDPFISFVTAMANMPSPPSVNSISWGAVEQSLSVAALNAFNMQAMKLAAMGVTLFASSGDDGVAGADCSCTDDSSSTISSWGGSGSWAGTGYFPGFPATSPYVTAVGATMGAGGTPPATMSKEIACQGDTGGVITSGGGFSTFYPQPTWQSSAVASFLTKQSPASGFNPQGRGIPDIAFLGVAYPVMIEGSLVALYGTSASSPVAAAFTSLVNAQRLLNGQGSVGYINPTLYSNAAKFNDVRKGSNNCCSSEKACCTAGFTATSGWDPVTGLGSITFHNFLSLFVDVPTSVPTEAPTGPSLAPSSSPTPITGICAAFSSSNATTSYPAPAVSMLGIESEGGPEHLAAKQHAEAHAREHVAAGSPPMRSRADGAHRVPGAVRKSPRAAISEDTDIETDTAGDNTGIQTDTYSYYGQYSGDYSYGQYYDNLYGQYYDYYYNYYSSYGSSYGSYYYDTSYYSYGGEFLAFGNCTVELCPGTVMTASGCAEGACSGDQLLYLTDANGTVVTFNDNACGLCSEVSYVLPPTASSCQTLTIHEACMGSSDCSGQISISGATVEQA